MTETLYRKSWQPLTLADKSSEQLVRYSDDVQRTYAFTARWKFPDGPWVKVPTDSKINTIGLYEFLCLEPVEVETDEFPKVI